MGESPSFFEILTEIIIYASKNFHECLGEQDIWIRV